MATAQQLAPDYSVRHSYPLARRDLPDVTVSRSASAAGYIGRGREVTGPVSTFGPSNVLKGGADLFAEQPIQVPALPQRMTTYDHDVSDESGYLAPEPPSQPWRRGLWALAAALKAGGMLTAVFIAVGLSNWGVIALGAVVAGFILRGILIATSRGD